MTFTLTPGRYQAGFRTVRSVDPSRTFDDAIEKPRSRPIQLYIWYPAEPNASAQPMRYDEYIYRSAADTRPATSISTRPRVLSAFASSVGLFDETRRMNEFRAPTAAYPEARAATGRFPLVLYAPGFNAPAFENSVLCEYLATHGFIVLATSSVGWHQRIMTSDQLGLEAQVRDMEFVLSLAASIPSADLARVAAIGYSWGGLADVLLQLRSPTIRAVVSLDGSIAYDWQSFVRAPSAELARMDVPFLFLGQVPLLPDTARKYGIDTTFTYFDSLSSTYAYRVSFPLLRHGNFSALSMRLLPREIGEADQTTVNVGYEQIVRYILNFLNSSLRADTAATAFLARAPEANGLPVGFATIDRRVPQKPARNLAAFVHQLGPTGPRRASATLSELRNADPGYTLPEELVNGWGYDLLAQGSFPDAVEVLSLNTVMYPGSSNAWDGLGEALMAVGRNQEAIASYQRSVTLDPANSNAKRRLTVLQALASP